jgi:hypothetical protein
MCRPTQSVTIASWARLNNRHVYSMCSLQIWRLDLSLKFEEVRWWIGWLVNCVYIASVFTTSFLLLSSHLETKMELVQEKTNKEFRGILSSKRLSERLRSIDLTEFSIQFNNLKSKDGHECRGSRFNASVASLAYVNDQGSWTSKERVQREIK